MMNKLLSAVAAVAFAAGSAQAVTIVDVDEPFIGSQTGEAGVFFTEEFGNTDQFRFDVTAGSDTSYAFSFSSDGLETVLDRIRVGVGSSTDSFDMFTGDDFGFDFEEGETVGFFDFGTIEGFFGTFEEDFSVFVQLLDGPEVQQAFDLNIFASSTFPVDGEVPIPGAGILLATSLGGLAMARRRRKA
jgi:hypothetical protein